MKYNLITKLLAGMAIAVPLGLSAQTDENTELQKTIQVYSEYKPQISDASRISVNPQVYDTLDFDVNLKYDISTSPLKTDYHIIPLKAVSVKGDKLQELYRGELVAGLGNYWSSLFALRFMTERSRLRQSGVEFYHYGSYGKVKMLQDRKVPAGYSVDYFSAYWKRFFENMTVYASIKPQYRSVLRYGYDTTADQYLKLTDDIKKSIRRPLVGLNANGGLVSTDSDVDALQYSANFDYDLTFAMNPNCVENLFDLSGSVGRKLGDVFFGAEADYEASVLNFEPTDSLMGSFQSVLRAKPYVRVGSGYWNLQAGVQLSPLLGGINSFKIFPDLRFTYSIPKLKMIPFVNVYGNADLFSMKEMFLENPYVADYVMIRPTINKIGFDLGVDGRLKKLVTYNVALTFRAYDDMYFWRANTCEDYAYSATPPAKNSLTLDEINTTYSAIYDDANLLKFHGDVGFLFRKLNFEIEMDYYHWMLDKINHPWFKPIFDLRFSPEISIVNNKSNKTKLTIAPKLSTMLYQSQGHGDIAILTNINLGLHAKYTYTSALQIFLDVNNFLGMEEFFMDYCTQQAPFLIGLSYSFGGHKE